jgi:hypothetical protein
MPLKAKGSKKRKPEEKEKHHIKQEKSNLKLIRRIYTPFGDLHPCHLN